MISLPQEKASNPPSGRGMFIPSSLDGIILLTDEQRAQGERDRTLQRIGTVDYGLVGTLKLYDSQLSQETITEAVEYWATNSRLATIGNAIRDAKERGSTRIYPFMTGNINAPDGIRSFGSINGRMGSPFSFGSITGTFNTNSDYFLFGGCELYK